MDWSDWLDEQGHFYTYVGYGQFLALPQDDERVKVRKKLLSEWTRLREGERERLRTQLSIRKYHQRQQHICAIMGDIVNLIRGH